MNKRCDSILLAEQQVAEARTAVLAEYQAARAKLSHRMGLPVFIGGTREAIPKGGWIFKTQVSGRLVVLPPIDTTKYKTADYAALRDLVHEKLQALASPYN